MRVFRFLGTVAILAAGLRAQTPVPQAAALLPPARQQFLDASGKPLSGGKLYFYQAGTSTPQDTYTDSSAAVKNANPIVLDSAGRAAIWIGGDASYKVAAYDKSGNLQWTADNVNEPALYYVAQLKAYINSVGDSALLTFAQVGTDPLSRSARDKLAETVSVADFCDPALTDHTACFQKAINRALAVGGRLYVNPGTWIVSPTTTDLILQIGSNLWIQGAGMGASVIKVKDGAGDYDVLFGPYGSVMNNLTFSDFSIDQNTTNNPTTASITTHGRLIIGTTSGGQNMVWNRVEMRDVDGVNAIYSGDDNTSVTNCFFVGIGGGATSHDASTLYIAGERATITGNIFESAGINSKGARTAIETHGGGQTVANNTITGMMTAMNITGVAATDSEQIAITGNVINDGYYGIHLWSYQHGAHTTGYGISGLVVSNNSIRLKQTEWTGMLGNPFGIGIDAPSNLPLKSLQFSDNIIEFDLETDPASPVNQTSMGIGYWDNTGVNTVGTVKISNNQIINPPVSGIRWSANASLLDISGNTIQNPGSTLNATLPSDYKSGIFIATPAATSLRLRLNTVSDANTTARMKYGIYLAPAAGSSVILRGNIFSVTGTDTTAFVNPMLIGSATLLPFLDDTVYAPNSSAFTPALAVAAGSRMYDAANKVSKKYLGGVWYDESGVIALSDITLRTNATCLKGTNASGVAGVPLVCLDGSNNINLGQSTYPTRVIGNMVLTANDATTSGGQVSLGNVVGTGNGASNAINAKAIGTGSGPTNANSVVEWLRVNIYGATAWIPVMQ